MKKKPPSELIFDKFIDLVLMFLGLYLAIAVQEFQDDRQAQSQYLKLLQGFRTEIESNMSQRNQVEAGLGALDDADAFGQAMVTFDYLDQNAAQLEPWLACFRDKQELSALRRRSAEQEAHLQRCVGVMRGYQRIEKPAPFEVSPLYRRDVWRFYLAGAVQLFQEFVGRKNQAEATCRFGAITRRGLAICVGSAYSELGEIEDRVEEIQRKVNETYFHQDGRLGALFQEFGARVRALRGLPTADRVRQTTEMVNRYLEEIRLVRREAGEVKRVVRFQIKQRKMKLQVLGTLFQEVVGNLQEELQSFD